MAIVYDQFGTPIKRSEVKPRRSAVGTASQEAVLRPSAVREKIIDDHEGFHIVKTQETQEILEGIHDAGTLLPKKTKVDGARYVGSIPLVLASQWAKECGAAIGSREFADYVGKKLASNEFRRLKVDYR